MKSDTTTLEALDEEYAAIASELRIRATTLSFRKKASTNLGAIHADKDQIGPRDAQAVRLRLGTASGMTLE